MKDIHKEVGINKVASNKSFRMKMDIGTVLYLEIPTIKSKIKSKLVTMTPGECLEGSLPMLIDPAFVEKCNNHKGAEVVCKYVYDEMVYGFRSHLISVVTTPKKIITLEYPTSAKVQELRRYERISILLPTKITFGTTTFYGSIVDINETGCQVTIMDNTSGVDVKGFISYASQSDIYIKVNLSGIKNNVTVPVVRNHLASEHDKVSVGFKFNYVDPQIQDLINRFISGMRKNETII
ncbi:MAG: PilZ domain-containing protein [Candidatus Anammoxibacter sp.]